MKKATSIPAFLVILLASLFIAPPVFPQQVVDLFTETEEGAASPCKWSGDLMRKYVQIGLFLSGPRETFALASVTDPYYNSSGSWGQAYDDMWGLKRVNAENAWKLSTGLGAVVAVLDTGIDYYHADIDGNIWTNAPEISGSTGVDNDLNGLIDDKRGWDFYNSDSNPVDDHGHGTHVAGIIAAEGNNASGVIGLAYGSKVMPVKVFSSSGTTTSTAIATGIRYAADMGAKILNCSFALPYYSNVVDALLYAYNKGCIIVAAAGNDNSTISEYPAILDYVITVGSINPSDTRSYFSNYGSSLDVVAPGEDILSLRASGTNAAGDSSYLVPSGISGAQYLRMSGTSMATPFVSALAALLYSQDPDLTFAEFSRRLKFSSYDLGAVGRDNYFGWGAIDAFAALSHDWYDSGAVKTWWLTDPDADNVIRYDYFESGAIRMWTFDSPDEFNVISYSVFDTNRLDSKYLASPDGAGKVRYSYFNEVFGGGNGRQYASESVSHETSYTCGFVNGTISKLVTCETSFGSSLGGGAALFYYGGDMVAPSAAKFVFDDGGYSE